MTTTVITGASSGIGLELARLAAAAGRDLVLIARSADKLEALAGELSAAHGVVARALPADLTDAAAPATIEAALAADGVTVDELVNNAGFGSNGRFHALPLDGELGQIDVNVRALVELTHRFVGPMVARGRGRVLNIASTAGFQPGPGMATYYATKAFVVSFSEAVNHELRGTGVTVTAHCPGPVHTGFGARAGNDRSMLFKGAVAEAEPVARHAWAAMQAGRGLAIHGWLNWLMAFSNRFSPRAVVRAVAWRLNR